MDRSLKEGVRRAGGKPFRSKRMERKNRFACFSAFNTERTPQKAMVSNTPLHARASQEFKTA
jgi:hypothetical protein